MSDDYQLEERIWAARQELEKKFSEPFSEEELHRWIPGVPARRKALIHLTKLNGSDFILNPELIEMIESTPDTIITMVTGRKYIVRETVDDVRARCLDYKQKIAQKTFV